MFSEPHLKPFIHMGAVVAATAIVGLIAGTRLQQRGQWLPEVPNQIGPWIATDVPLESDTVKTLGEPQTLGRQYKNPLDEAVDAHVIAAESFDAYHEPAMCMSGYGFTLTAQMFPEVFGSGNQARAMVLKHEDSGIRVLMLYWVQFEDGHTTGIGDLHGYQDLRQRLSIGLNAITNNKQCVIVRAYTRVAPGASNIAQARRNLYEVARGMYQGIKNDGTIWKKRNRQITQQAAAEKHDAG